MNTFTKRITLVLAGILASGAGLVAQDTATPKREAHVERRAERQQKRIDQGVASGKMTPQEAANAERRQAKLQGDIAKAEADGKITKKEHAKLSVEENRNSRKIYRKKHNAKGN
jgi:hypothetical protein